MPAPINNAIRFLRVTVKGSRPQPGRLKWFFRGNPIIARELSQSGSRQINTPERIGGKRTQRTRAQIHFRDDHERKPPQEHLGECGFGLAGGIQDAITPQRIVKSLRNIFPKISPRMTCPVYSEKLSLDGQQRQFARCEICRRSGQPGFRRHALRTRGLLQSPFPARPLPASQSQSCHRTPDFG